MVTMLVLQERVAEALRVATAGAQDRLRQRAGDAEVADLDFEVRSDEDV